MAKKSLDDVKRISSRLIRQNTKNVARMYEQDEMWELNWELTEEIKKLGWVKRRVSAAPHDNIRNGAAMFSGIAPRLKITSLNSTKEGKKKVDHIEKGLMWEFSLATERRQNLLYDIMIHALKYDMICAQIIYLPYMDDHGNAFKGEDLRKKAALRYGKYAIVLRDPKHTFAEFSHYMMERVVNREHMTAWECVDFWGDDAKEIKDMIDNNGDDELWVTVYDYHDYDVRYVWAVTTKTQGEYLDANFTGGADVKESAGQGSFLIKEMENDLPFIPWQVERGSDDVIPLLIQSYETWKDMNLVSSLLTSEVIAYSAAPRYKVEGPSDNIDVDYGEPARPAYVPPGHDLTALAPPVLDSAMATIKGEIENEFDRSALPAILQGDTPSGAAFATVNLASQSAVKKLNPYKQLAQRFLAGVFKKKMFWLSHTGDTLETYPEILQENGEIGTTQYNVNPADWDVDHLYVSVELIADTVVDKMSQINAASMAIQQLDYTQTQALEDVGVHNASTMIEEARREKEERALDEVETLRKVEEIKTDIELDKKRKHADLDMDLARKQEELRKEMEAAAQQPPQQPQNAQPGVLPSQAELMQSPQAQAAAAQNRGSNAGAVRGALGALQGQNFDPSRGGSSAVEGAPQEFSGGGGKQEAQSRASFQSGRIARGAAPPGGFQR